MSGFLLRGFRPASTARPGAVEVLVDAVMVDGVSELRTPFDAEFVAPTFESEFIELVLSRSSEAIRELRRACLVAGGVEAAMSASAFGEPCSSRGSEFEFARLRLGLCQ